MAATGTLMPAAVFTGWDINGDPLASGKLYTYAAGTSTPLATYSDVALTTPNANPIILDAAGRATVFLAAASYKLVLKNAADVTEWTQDNVAATPPFNVDVDVAGTAGEAIAAGEAVYLSGGDGGKTAGRWYLADADFAYASSAALFIGMAPSAVASGAPGSFRIQGRITGLSGLTAGTKYYVSATAGALTATPPANNRFVGAADSTTTILLAPNPSQQTSIPLAICEGRLTATTAVPVTTADVTGATSIYYAPYQGNRIALFDGSATWNLRSFSEITISLAGLTASMPYDVFAYDVSGVVTIETLIWTNATTRATALVRQDGVLVKSGATTRRYLGTVYINASGGQTDDTLAKRYIFNNAHRVMRALRRIDPTVSWTYTTAAWRQANASAANQLDVMVGVAEEAVSIRLMVSATNSSTNTFRHAGIGEDGVTAPVATSMLLHFQVGSVTGAGEPSQHHAEVATVPSVGRHYWTWLEYSQANGTCTWYGDAGVATATSGLTGWVRQ